MSDRVRVWKRVFVQIGCLGFSDVKDMYWAQCLCQCFHIACMYVCVCVHIYFVSRIEMISIVSETVSANVKEKEYHQSRTIYVQITLSNPIKYERLEWWCLKFKLNKIL